MLNVTFQHVILSQSVNDVLKQKMPGCSARNNYKL